MLSVPLLSNRILGQLFQIQSLPSPSYPLDYIFSDNYGIWRYEVKKELEELLNANKQRNGKGADLPVQVS